MVLKGVALGPAIAVVAALDALAAGPGSARPRLQQTSHGQ